MLKFWKISLFVAVIILLVIIYSKFNPENSGIFPKCPFKLLTGYDCAGCGSQRAIHYLLNGKISSAFHSNALLVLSLPYILLGLLFDWFHFKNKTLLKVKRILYGTAAIWIVLAIVVLWWILRNVN